MSVSCQLTVLFEDPFWIGLAERRDETGYAVARIVFGAEPTDAELYAFVQQQYATLSFSQPLPEESTEAGHVNFKRKQREARRLLSQPATRTKAQEALQLELERHKQERRGLTKAERQAEAERQWNLRQQRRKEKKQGH
jgi:hypothetical protein